ncbi:hypothetical protein VTH06DRAFT_2340 [Thermothelomyces fergusii]
MAAHAGFVWIKNDLSADGRAFRLTRQAARHSAILRGLLDALESTDARQQEEEACVPITIDVSDQCLSDVLQWAENTRIPPGTGEKNDDDDDDDKPVELAAEDVRFFREAITSSARLYELLVLADYLGIVPLYEMACRVVADMTVGKSGAQICRMLGISRELGTEQEEVIGAETVWDYDEEQLRYDCYRAAGPG